MLVTSLQLKSLEGTITPARCELEGPKHTSSLHTAYEGAPGTQLYLECFLSPTISALGRKSHRKLCTWLTLVGVVEGESDSGRGLSTCNRAFAQMGTGSLIGLRTYENSVFLAAKRFIGMNSC